MKINFILYILFLVRSCAMLGQLAPDIELLKTMERTIEINSNDHYLILPLEDKLLPKVQTITGKKFSCKSIFNQKEEAKNVSKAGECPGDVKLAQFIIEDQQFFIGMADQKLHSAKFQNNEFSFQQTDLSQYSADGYSQFSINEDKILLSNENEIFFAKLSANKDNQVEIKEEIKINITSLEVEEAFYAMEKVFIVTSEFKLFYYDKEKTNFEWVSNLYYFAQKNFQLTNSSEQTKFQIQFFPQNKFIILSNNSFGIIVISLDQLLSQPYDTISSVAIKQNSIQQYTIVNNFLFVQTKEKEIIKISEIILDRLLQGSFVNRKFTVKDTKGKDIIMTANSNALYIINDNQIIEYQHSLPLAYSSTKNLIRKYQFEKKIDQILFIDNEDEKTQIIVRQETQLSIVQLLKSNTVLKCDIKKYQNKPNFQIQFTYLTKKILEGIEFNEFYRNNEIITVNLMTKEIQEKQKPIEKKKDKPIEKQKKKQTEQNNTKSHTIENNQTTESNQITESNKHTENNENNENPLNNENEQNIENNEQIVESNTENISDKENSFNWLHFIFLLFFFGVLLYLYCFHSDKFKRLLKFPEPNDEQDENFQALETFAKNKTQQQQQVEQVFDEEKRFGIKEY